MYMIWWRMPPHPIMRPPDWDSHWISREAISHPTDAAVLRLPVTGVAELNSGGFAKIGTNEVSSLIHSLPMHYGQNMFKNRQNLAQLSPWIIYSYYSRKQLAFDYGSRFISQSSKKIDLKRNIHEALLQQFRYVDLESWIPIPINFNGGSKFFLVLNDFLLFL